MKTPKDTNKIPILMLDKINSLYIFGLYLTNKLQIESIA